jgi:hypothetical protein
MTREDYLLERLVILENVVEALGKVLCNTSPTMQSSDMSFLGDEWSRANNILDDKYAKGKDESEKLRVSPTETG